MAAAPTCQRRAVVETQWSPRRYCSLLRVQTPVLRCQSVQAALRTEVLSCCSLPAASPGGWNYCAIKTRGTLGLLQCVIRVCLLFITHVASLASDPQVWTEPKLFTAVKGHVMFGNSTAHLLCHIFINGAEVK